MTREIILHAGTHKTGTSSIQTAFLVLSHPDLEYLPWGRKTPSGHNVAYSQTFVAEPESLVDRQENVTSLEDAKAFQARLRAELQQAVGQSTASRVLISAEAIANSSEESVAALKGLLDPFASAYRIMIYVRSPIDYAASSVQQSLKNGIIRDFPPQYNFIVKLSKFIKVFGRSAIEVYEFAPEKLLDGDVVADFAHRLGTAIPKQTAKQANVSASLQVSALNYLYWQRFRPEPGIVSETIRSLAMAQALAELGTAKLSIHRDVFKALLSRTSRQFEWMENTFDIRLNRSLPQVYGGIRCLDDLIPLALAQEEGLSAIAADRLATSPIPTDAIAALTARLTDLSPEADAVRRVAGKFRVLRELITLEMKLNPALRHIR